MVVLGIDGMDHVLLSRFMREGLMPNFKRLSEAGSFNALNTSIPPQSPVAWSDFAVGATAGVHGIFDFIHRDPQTMIPFFSTSQVVGSTKTIKSGRWEIPIKSGQVLNLRGGKPFWEYLGEAGIPATIFKMPGNFPASAKTGRCVSGLGTPDLTGSYGQFSFFTSNPDNIEEDLSGGVVIPVEISNHIIDTELLGPVNTFRVDRPHAAIPLLVFRDPENEVVKVQLQDHTLLMNRGEWSDWLPVSFEMVPLLNSVKGICKILVKQVHPHFEMYISPIHIDPRDQSLPVTAPESYGGELAGRIGLFGTKGLPADTKALSGGVLSEAEYLQASEHILAESGAALRYELDRLGGMDNGLLFFYFSNIDQDSHMFWGSSEKAPSLEGGESGVSHEDVMREMYVKMDQALEEVYTRFDIDDPDFSLIVMSDHGFAPFDRAVNLNTWLFEKGYAALIDPDSRGEHELFGNVDWSATRAYGLGINALYVNLQGREKWGLVSPGQKRSLLKQLKGELLALTDPQTGASAVSGVWLVEDLYQRRDDIAPDLIIGWNRGYRASWDTVLGAFSWDVFEDNDDKWRGDHCIDPRWVPGILLTSKPVTRAQPCLTDITATILAEFDIAPPKQMIGQQLYGV